MKYVHDASVAICWVISRPLTPQAVRLRDEYQGEFLKSLSPRQQSQFRDMLSTLYQGER